MKIKNSKISGIAVASVFATGALTAVPFASYGEVEASAAVANMYLWRGVDLGRYSKADFKKGSVVESGGGGVGAISGDINYSNSGFYAGVWASSGDSNVGTEYDLYAGYGTEFAGVSFDLNVTTYIYPSNPDGSRDNPGEFTEVILSLGFAGASATIYDNVAGGSGYAYYTLGYELDAFSVLFGKHDKPGVEDEDTSHLDLSYAYKDNLSFTVSQQVDEEIDNKKAKFVVSYSLPIDL